MSRTKSGALPSYRQYKRTGQAVVTLGGRDHYLGTYGTTERFARVLRAAGVPVKTHGTAGKDHSTLNNDLGLPDDKPTQEMFEFLSQARRRQ